MRQRKVAFTLIELLVVIAILGLLLAILLPTLSSARKHAKANVCLSSLKAIGTGLALYIDENSEQLPPHRLKTIAPDMDENSEPYANEYRRHWPRWQWFLALGDEPVIDPLPFRWYIAARGWFDDDAGIPDPAGGRRMTSPHFICPSLADDFALDVRDGAYGYNYQYLGNARTDTIENRWDNFSVASHRLRSAAQTIVAADSRGAGRKHGQHSFTLDPPRLAVEHNATRFGPSADDLPSGLDAALYQYSPAEPRHNNLANVVFLDTHAEAMSLKQLGYQLNEKAVAQPILDPLTGTYTASNKMWTGKGKDRIAAEHHR